MTDDMQTRVSRAEWEIEALKEGQSRHDDRMTELSTRIDVQHREVMEAIGSLKDDKARNEGAAEARLADASRNQVRLKWLSFVLAAIGTLVALGWVGESKSDVLPVKSSSDAPVQSQWYSRELQ